MTEQWQELKETIIELRDNNGTGTQQEVCKFLANYMDTLEKQITDEGDVLDKIRAEIKALTDGAETERIWNVDVLAIIDKYRAEKED